VFPASLSMQATQLRSGVRVASEHEHVAIARLVALAVMQDATWEVTSAQVDWQLAVAEAMMSGRNWDDEAEVDDAAAAEAVPVAEPEADPEADTAATAYEAAAVMGSVPFEPRGAMIAAPKAEQGSKGQEGVYGVSQLILREGPAGRPKSSGPLDRGGLPGPASAPRARSEWASIEWCRLRVAGGNKCLLVKPRKKKDRKASARREGRSKRQGLPLAQSPRPPSLAGSSAASWPSPPGACRLPPSNWQASKKKGIHLLRRRSIIDTHSHPVSGRSGSRAGLPSPDPGTAETAYCFRQGGCAGGTRPASRGPRPGVGQARAKGGGGRSVSCSQEGRTRAGGRSDK